MKPKLRFFLILVTFFTSLNFNPQAFGKSNGQQIENSYADTLILSLLDEINPDSIEYSMQYLENFGTRFMMAPNRFEIVDWIKSKFTKYGYSDVVVDTFESSSVWGTDTTTLQMNVVATLEGSERPDDKYIIGAHYDAIIMCWNCDPMSTAPGADDNASGTAAVLEIARVMKKMNYVPEATIKLITFGPEETGDPIGSEYFAEEAYNTDMNIEIMINLDMISNNTKAMDISGVNVVGYPGFEEHRDYGLRMTSQYSTLEPLSDWFNFLSDPVSFTSLGYPAIWFFEDEFSPNYHDPTDLVIHCNMDYCAEVTRASLATLISFIGMPTKAENLTIVDMGDGESLLLNWRSPIIQDFLGYNIHLGTESGIYDTTLSSSDTSITLNNLIEGIEYYIGMTTYDEDGYESFLIEETGTPLSYPLSPSGFEESPLWHKVRLSWSPNLEYDLLGYNIYRSTTDDELGTKLNPEVLTDTTFTDESPDNGIYYYYTVKSVDSMQNESINNVAIRSRSVSLDQGIVLVDESEDGDGSLLNPTDEETDDFYNSILIRFERENFDVIEENGISLADLGAFSTVIWHGDDYADLRVPLNARDDIQKYLEFGGNLIYTGYMPSKAFESNVLYPTHYSPDDFIYDYLKIASVDKQFGSRFHGAIPVTEGYNEVYTDSNKTKESYNFHLANIEAIEASPSGTVIYSYETDFDTNTAQGSMKDDPVGVEYIGEDYKVVTLSFPLYYMQFDQAKTLMEYILTEKFSEVVSLKDEKQSITPKEFVLEQNYPNPFNPSTKIKFALSKAEVVKIEIYNTLGQGLETLLNEHMKAGQYEVEFNGSNLSSGIYFYQIEAGDFQDVKKMVLIK